MKKKICVLQVTPKDPNPDHVSYFKEKEDSDFFFVTHEEPHQDSLLHCPNTTWSETRDILIKLAPKEYEYYALIDYDYILRPQRNLGVLEQMLQDLEYNPAVLTYYPGTNLETPYALDTDYYESRDYSCIPFTHFGLKIIHHSLLKWFFPLCRNFSVNVDSCHMFNIQEIPFMKNVICSHKMKYDNGYSDPDAVYNKDGPYSKYKMDEMWKWISESFKMRSLLEYYKRTPQDMKDSLFIKKCFVDIMKTKNINPEPSPPEVDYYDKERIEKVFDTRHEYFANRGKGVEVQYMELDEEFVSEVEEILRKEVTFSRLKTKENPWKGIVHSVNSKLKHRRGITMNECHEIYQKMDRNESLFIKNSKTNADLVNYLKDKTVAFVGPASYLVGKSKGKLIDSHDVVVRIQPEIWDEKDFGSRTDIIQSCLNSSYSPKVVKFLENTPINKRPKFIICNDTVAREVPHPGSGKWLSVVREYEDYLKKYGVPLAHLKNPDDTWERWALYWEIYAKPHIEKVSEDLYTHYSGNFNSGYGAINHVLSCPVKQLSVFGVDFYNFGVVRGMQDKYNPAYIEAQGRDGTYLGPDTMLHDQISQIMHCKNVLEKDPRFKLDKEVKERLHKEELNERINKFKKLPKVLHTTQ